MRATLLCAAVVVGSFSLGCGGSDPPAKDGSSQKVCDAVVDLALKCYDVSTPEVECETVKQAAKKGMEEAGATASADSIGELCETACGARKQGQSRMQVNEALVKACPK